MLVLIYIQISYHIFDQAYVDDKITLWKKNQKKNYC